MFVKTAPPENTLSTVTAVEEATGQGYTRDSAKPDSYFGNSPNARISFVYGLFALLNQAGAMQPL